MEAPKRTIRADRGDAGERLDRALVRHLADLALPRVEVARWIRAGKVEVNGDGAPKPALKLAKGDVVYVTLPPPPADAPPLVAQELPLVVVWEDAHLLALDKPPGLVVHPTWGHRDGTLLNGLLWRARDWDAERERPRLVHRLDKDTSGLLLVAKTRAAHAGLARAFQRRQVRKEYLAVVHGSPPADHGLIALPIARDVDDPKRRVAGAPDGRPAITSWEVAAEGTFGGERFALLRCRPETGRTHQIRVHLAAIGCAIVGDPLYGPPPAGVHPRQALHAARLAFAHPVGGEPLALEAPLPADLRGLLERLGVASALIADEGRGVRTRLREVPERVVARPRRARLRVDDAQVVLDVGGARRQHPVAAVEGAAVEHLHGQLRVVGREEPELTRAVTG